MISFRQADLFDRMRPKYILEIFPLSDQNDTYLGESETAYEYRPHDETKGRWGIQKDHVAQTWERDGQKFILKKYMADQLKYKSLELYSPGSAGNYENLGKVIDMTNAILTTDKGKKIRPEKYRWYGDANDRIFISHR